MQWLSGLPFGENPVVQIGLLVASGIAALAVLAIIYRFVFAHRLRVPGGRTRQPRLGLVDAFSLDGQRQLVLVRRDNVEHLVMIGGPNDVLVESQINRALAPVRENQNVLSATPPRRAEFGCGRAHGPGRTGGEGLAASGGAGRGPADPPANRVGGASRSDGRGASASRVFPAGRANDRAAGRAGRRPRRTGGGEGDGRAPTRRFRRPPAAQNCAAQVGDAAADHADRGGRLSWKCHPADREAAAGVLVGSARRRCTAGGRRRARFGPACGGGRSAAACVRRPRALGPTACPGSPSAVRQNAGRAGDSPCGGPCVRRRAGFDRTACCGFPSAARQNADCAGGARSGQSRSAGAGVEPRAWRCCPSGGRKNFCARCRGADDREGRASTRGRAGNVIRPTAAHAGPRSAGIDCRPSADRIA